MDYANIYTLALGIEKGPTLELYLLFFMQRGTNCSFWVVLHSSFPVGDVLRTPQLPPRAIGHSPPSMGSTAREPSSHCSLGWKFLIWPWKSGITNLPKEFCWLWQSSSGGKPFPPVPTVLWLVNTRLLSQTVFLERD